MCSSLVEEVSIMNDILFDEKQRDRFKGVKRFYVRTLRNQVLKLRDNAVDRIDADEIYFDDN